MEASLANDIKLGDDRGWKNGIGNEAGIEVALDEKEAVFWVQISPSGVLVGMSLHPEKQSRALQDVSYGLGSAGLRLSEIERAFRLSSSTSLTDRVKYESSF